MFKAKVFLSLSLMLLALCTEATQRIRIQEHGKTEGQISAQHLNHIAIENDRILSVKALKGQFELDQDLSLGHIFIKPLETAQNPLTIFLSTESGKTYGLDLRLAANHAQSILLDPRPMLQIESGDLSRLKTVIAALHREEPLEGFVQKTVNQRIRFSDVLQGRVMSLYQGPDFDAEILEVQNLSSERFFLDALDLYQDNVQAITIVNPVLDAKARTRVYWIKK